MKKLNFILYRQDELGTGGRTSTDEDDEEVNKTPAQLLAEKEAAEKAAAAEYDKEQKAIEAEHNAKASSQPKKAPAEDPDNYQRGGGGYARISRNIAPEVLRDYENGQYKGTDIRDFEKAYNKVRGMSNDELNSLRQEYAKGHYTLEGSIANAMLGMKLGQGKIENIQSAGDTSNTKVAQKVIQNKKSGDSNVITKTEEPQPEPEQETEGVSEVEEVAYAPDRDKIKELITKRDRGNGIDYPSVYTAYKNGLFGNPDDPESKKTYASFLTDHIMKSLGNRSTFHAVGNRVDKTTAEDVGGQQSLFDEKIKKDWTSQIDRYNKQQDDILQAKTNVITDNIEKLGGIQNDQDAIDFALSLKAYKPDEINKLINRAAAIKANNGTLTPEDYAFAQNPEKLAGMFTALQKAQLSGAQLANVAQGYANMLAKNNVDISNGTKWASILSPYLGMAGSVAKDVSGAVGGLIP